MNMREQMEGDVRGGLPWVHFERQLPEAAHSKAMLGGGLCILTVAEIKERMNEFFQKRERRKALRKENERQHAHLMLQGLPRTYLEQRSSRPMQHPFLLEGMVTLQQGNPGGSLVLPQ